MLMLVAKMAFLKGILLNFLLIVSILKYFFN